MAKLYKTNGCFRFFPVGQGMFYGGTISFSDSHDSVNFVYDCGAWNKGNKAISDKIIEGGQYFFHKKLDMLFVSHFDLDHVNGIPSLLKTLDRTSELVVVLPYYTLEELQVFQVRAAYYLSKSKEGTPSEREEIQRFTFNPYLYLLQSQKVGKVFVIYNGREERNGKKVEEEWGKGTKIYPFFENETVKKNLIRDLGIQEESKKLRVVNEELSGEFVEGWSWKAVVPPTSKASLEQFTKALRSEGLLGSDNHLSEKQFMECCKGKEGKQAKKKETANDKIKKAYKIIADINLTSLVVAHEPLIMNGYFSPETRLSTVLFGDTKLNGDAYNHFVNVLENELRSARFLSVPHHGAAGSWNREILLFPQQRAFWIVSAQTCSTYHHPHGFVVYDFLHCQAPCKQELYWCNEETVIDMEICCHNSYDIERGEWDIRVNHASVRQGMKRYYKNLCPYNV